MELTVLAALVLVPLAGCSWLVGVSDDPIVAGDMLDASDEDAVAPAQDGATADGGEEADAGEDAALDAPEDVEVE